MDDDPISDARASALDWALKANRLLDERYFDKVQDAIRKGAEGEAEFRTVCAEAELPEDMISTLWRMLMGADLRAVGYWC